MTSTPTKVMIVDDSAIIRTIIEKILKSDSGIKVTGTAGNGEIAVQTITECDPDLVILDIEMPVMDGLTAIPLLLKKKPGVKILVCSTLSSRGASVSLKALSLGATDYLLKPSGADLSRDAAAFHTQLLNAINILCKPKVPQGMRAEFTLKPTSILSPMPKVIAIGSSTGGPNALMKLLKNMKNMPVPIVITQHMPKTFTKIMADHIAAETGIPTIEVEDGTIIKPGCAYVAPGGYHMTFKGEPGAVSVVLNDGPPENFCKPSVDPMLRSLISIYGSNILTIILTGMGSDGLEGCKMVSGGGGVVIAQDAATSVVWGMPGAVANAGICSAVLPLEKIAEWVTSSSRLGTTLSRSTVKGEAV